MRKALILAAAALAGAVSAVPAQAAPFTLGPRHLVSGVSPFAPGCGGPGEAGPGSVLYQNAEVETHVAVNPTNGNNVVAYWQQDRWNDGGAHGNLAAYSFNGGATWGYSAPRFTRCSGGAGLGNAGDYERGTDPWLSFSPNGRLHAVALVFDNSTPRNAVLAAFSDDGGATWSLPRIVRFDNPRARRGRYVQTIGNMVDVLPDGTLINGFNYIQAISNRQRLRGYTVALMRSTDAPATSCPTGRWTGAPIPTRAATSMSSGWTAGSTTPTTTTSCSRGRPTAG